MKSNIRLSQCMIVKNEEKNIRQALSWGKGVVFEQIVVDTGSTDRTVEIAEEMGAKVYHFVWTNNFSAAKNFAIEKAKGDWIAFLDADEYFDQEGVKCICDILSSLQAGPKAYRPSIIRSLLLHLDDEGKVFSSALQDRVFCNSPHIRYKNKIHEMLYYIGQGQLIVADESKRSSIYHTGYAPTIYRETNKLERNIIMLQKELEEHPENGDNWSYLGDSLSASERTQEAKEAYIKALSTPLSSMITNRRNAAYSNLIQIYSCEANREEEILGLYAEFEKTHNVFPDVEYWIGLWTLGQKKEVEAVFWLEKALAKLEVFTGDETLILSVSLGQVYGILLDLCHKQGDKVKAVRYSMLALRLSRFTDAAIDTLLALLKDEPGEATGADATFGLLNKLYHFDELKDKLYILKTARKVGFHSLDRRIFRLLSKKEQLWMLGFPQSEYRLTKEEFENHYPNIKCDNEIDIAFLTLMEEITCKSQLQLQEDIRKRLEDLERDHKQDFDTFAAYVNCNPLWGCLYPQQQDYGAVDVRADALKEHQEDFLWLYSNLEDYRSKQSLYAILENWLYVSNTLLDQIKEKGSLYYDTDIIPSVKGETCINIGSESEDTILDFFKTYGEVCGHITCYEARPEAIEQLKTKLTPFEHVTVCEGTGLNLDEDIKEAVNLIKIDLTELGHEVLRGCSRHIKEEHPKLTVCVYYGYEDIWRIPRMMKEMDPSYRFYIRYYGGNLIPTKFVLFAV